MNHPLIDRLTTELGWPRPETEEALAAVLSRPGLHCVLIPGDPAKNLETTDAAVIAPEVHAAFQGRFDMAVAGDGIERALRDRHDVWPTPSLFFFDGDRFLGAVPRVRDWDDYLASVRRVLDGARADA